MNLSKLSEAWNNFFFRPIPAYSLGLFRAAYGFAALVTFALIAPDAFVWYGEDGVLPMAVAAKTLSGSRLNLFAVLPPSDLTVQCVVGGAMLGALGVMLGLRTRASSILLWICVVSLHHRDVFLLNSGDHLLRNLSFLLMFAPAGRAFSLDRWLRIRRGVEPPGVPMVAPWSQRLLQFQVCAMYLSSVLWKLSGTAWIDGTAAYYIGHLDEFKRFPVPAMFHTLAFSHFATWGAIAVEAAMGTLVWFRPLRIPVLFAGILLHLGLEYAMNIPTFQWVVLSSYFLFLDEIFWTTRSPSSAPPSGRAQNPSRDRQ